MKERRFKLFLGAHPAWAVAEAGLLNILLLAGLFALQGRVPANLLSQGMFFICCGIAFWCAIRSRPLDARKWPARWGLEALTALGLALVLGLTWLLGSELLGWTTALAGTGLAWIGQIVYPMAAAAAFFALRLGAYTWLLWGRLRRQHLHWALTHVAVQIVLLFALLAMAFFVLAFLSGDYLPDAGGWGVEGIVDTLVYTVLPAVGVVAAMAFAGLAVVLPPIALVATLFFRRTTRRLDALAGAASVMRQGDYGARVEVEGEDEVAQLQGDFNAMAAELERVMGDLQLERDKVTSLLQSQRELVASVSHELRTPVATIRGHLESGQARCGADLPEAMIHDLAVMDSEVIRLQGLIDDLFALSRAEAGGLELDLQPADVAAVIERQVAALAPLAWSSGKVEVTYEVPPELPPALADETRLAQILANLLRNAVAHTGPGGIVAVVAAAEHASVRIEIRDTGEGINPLDLPHIWDPFYQGTAETHGDRSGAGLGLALVKELTEAMGGTVSVESAPGRGSRFSVWLPLAQAP